MTSVFTSWRRMWTTTNLERDVVIAVVTQVERLVAVRTPATLSSRPWPLHASIEEHKNTHKKWRFAIINMHYAQNYANLKYFQFQIYVLDYFSFGIPLGIIVDVIELHRAVGALAARYALQRAQNWRLFEVVTRHRARCTTGGELWPAFALGCVRFVCRKVQEK